jgi:hypothetical protein
LGLGEDVFERERLTVEVIHVPKGHAADVLNAYRDPGCIIGLPEVVNSARRGRPGEDSSGLSRKSETFMCRK